MYRPQIDLAGVSALAATNYTKKPNVFRLKLSNGGEYLFHAKDEVLPFVRIIFFIFCSLSDQYSEWWGADMVICLDRGADLHTV